MSDSPEAQRGGRRAGGEQWRSISERRQKIVSVREEIVERRGWLGAAIDWIGRILTNPLFFSLFLLAHLAWIVLNLGWVPAVEPWDPYPFVFLATVASAEAPFVALLVLMWQQRDRRINEVREEVSLQVSLHVERENTAILRMLREMGRQMELAFDREEIDELTKDLDAEDLMSTVRHRLEEAGEQDPADE